MRVGPAAGARRLACGALPPQARDRRAQARPEVRATATDSRRWRGWRGACGSRDGDAGMAHTDLATLHNLVRLSWNRADSARASRTNLAHASRDDGGGRRPGNGDVGGKASEMALADVRVSTMTWHRSGDCDFFTTAANGSLSSAAHRGGGGADGRRGVRTSFDADHAHAAHRRAQRRARAARGDGQGSDHLSLVSLPRVVPRLASRVSLASSPVSPRSSRAHCLTRAVSGPARSSLSSRSPRSSHASSHPSSRSSLSTRSSLAPPLVIVSHASSPT